MVSITLSTMPERTPNHPPSLKTCEPPNRFIGTPIDLLYAQGSRPLRRRGYLQHRCPITRISRFPPSRQEVGGEEIDFCQLCSGLIPHHFLDGQPNELLHYWQGWAKHVSTRLSILSRVDFWLITLQACEEMGSLSQVRWCLHCCYPSRYDEMSWVAREASHVCIPLGWTKTDLSDSIEQWMSKYAAHVPRLTPDEAGAGLVKTSEALTLEKTGLFWHFDGTNLPW